MSNESKGFWFSLIAHCFQLIAYKKSLSLNGPTNLFQSKKELE